MHAPPIAMLADPVSVQRHADCLRAVLAPTSLHVVLHAPDDAAASARARTTARSPGCSTSRVAVGADARRLPRRAPAGRRRAPRPTASRTACSPRSARCAASPRAPSRSGRRSRSRTSRRSIPARRELCHAPLFVRDLVRRSARRLSGMAFDLGHAHITSQLAGVALVDVLRAVRDDVVLFARARQPRRAARAGHAAGDPPAAARPAHGAGRGTLPWRAIAPLLRAHPRRC